MKVPRIVQLAGALIAAWAVWRVYQARRRGVPSLLVLQFPFVPVDQIDQVNRAGVGPTVRDQLLSQMNWSPPPWGVSKT